MSNDLRVAEALIEQLRNVILPPPPPMVRAGELGEVLGGISRTQAWVLAKSPGFPRPIVLGPKTRMWRRAEVERWLAAHQEGAKESPGSEAGANIIGSGARRGKRRLSKSISDGQLSPQRRR
jgi:predicted DNA-binding transcriptional regulator AlpA